jgi:hypothetical protein
MFTRRSCCGYMQHVATCNTWKHATNGNMQHAFTHQSRGVINAVSACRCTLCPHAAESKPEPRSACGSEGVEGQEDDMRMLHTCMEHDLTCSALACTMH